MQGQIKHESTGVRISWGDDTALTCEAVAVSVNRVSTWAGQGRLPEEAGLGVLGRLWVSREEEEQRVPDAVLLQVTISCVPGQVTILSSTMVLRPHTTKMNKAGKFISHF